ncbi:MAG: hypothetical protein R2912_11615 [Eubacteriales bacterium]
MNIWMSVLIGVLALALVVLIIVRVRLKKRLDSIDGFVGLTQRGEYDGRVIGGAMTKVYRHQNTNRR